MAKKGSIKFVCQNCGAIHSSWMGRCSVCGEWNTITEQAGDEILSSPSGRTLKPVSMLQAKEDSAQKARIKTYLPGVDTVLGGGFVPGSVTLLAGQPGIGKSTLLLQVAARTAKQCKVLYISGEESVHQVSMRATRLGLQQDSVSLVSSESADDIAATIATGEYDLVIVDSIQTVSVKAVMSAAGSVAQITNSTHMLMRASKTTGVALLLVGHVTKEGSIAGPKVLEHVVDTVLQLEGDRYGGFKILRSVKNRFGSTHESTLFEMKEEGLVEVENPSAALLEERQASDGSVVLATIEGARPLLVEVQALVHTTSYGYPKRTASGVDLNRVNVLIAMLEKRTKLQLSDKDIYINIVGGLKITEPAADLAIVMAIASAAKGMRLKEDVVVFGEIGLSGEIRRVPFADKRINEAKKLGFKGVLAPKGSSEGFKGFVSEVTNTRDALNAFLSK